MTKQQTNRSRPVAAPGNYLKALPIILLATIVLVISLFFVSPYSKRKLFAVQGAVGTTREELIEKSGIKSSDYISQVLLNLKKHEKAIVKNDPWVKSAKMTYEFPNRFYLTVEEYEIVAYAKSKDGWQPVLSSGDFLDSISESDLPSQYLAIDLSDKKDISQLSTKLADLDEEVLGSIATISSAQSTSTKDLLLLTTTQGHQIRVPLSEVDVKLPYYKTIKDKLTSLRMIDMEVGIYTTALDGQAQVSQETTEVASEMSQVNQAEQVLDQTMQNQEVLNQPVQEELNLTQDLQVQPIQDQQLVQNTETQALDGVTEVISEPIDSGQ